VPAGLLKLSHLIFATLYLALPPLVLIIGSSRRLRYPGRRTSLGVLFSSGIVLGAAVAVVHALVAAAPVPLGQVLVSGYLAIGLLLLIRGLDWSVAVALGLDPARRYDRRPRLLREILLRLAPLLRFAVLISLAFPFVVMSLVCFRPRVVPIGDPASRLRVDYQLVHFPSSDGLTLAGWWIPAPDQHTATQGLFGPDADQQPNFRRGTQTVLICHGFWGGKAGPLPIARFYLAAGYNVLLFDFRATGQSQGHLCTFGDLERQDVLGAVAYLRDQQSQQSQRIVGLGLGTGGAALLAAAADPSPQGQAIAAVAVIGCYDDLNDLSHQLADAAFLQPLGSLVWKVGLPLASLQTGADLQNFRPSDAANHLWPRPLMVVHGMDDNVVPLEAGQRLFNAASMPKQSLWIENADADQTAADPGVNRAILRFFNDAHPVPVI
jgi:alpha-beta hydrolase superfamily lysophospholipase